MPILKALMCGYFRVIVTCALQYFYLRHCPCEHGHFISCKLTIYLIILDFIIAWTSVWQDQIKLWVFLIIYLYAAYLKAKILFPLHDVLLTVFKVLAYLSGVLFENWMQFVLLIVNIMELLIWEMAYKWFMSGGFSISNAVNPQLMYISLSTLFYWLIKIQINIHIWVKTKILSTILSMILKSIRNP